MTMRKMVVAAFGMCAVIAEAAWEPGEPVVAYWGGPGYWTNEEKLDDRWLQQLKEGGFNTVWARTPEELDNAARYGMRAIYMLDPKTVWFKIDLDDAAQASALAERIDRVKNHPALYVYQHWDEPSAERFSELARVKEWIRRRDPNHATWINLLPTYANNKQLGVEGDRINAYQEHVRRYGEMYCPEFMTYDHYQFKTSGDAGNYFLNMGIIRQCAAAMGIPFWNGVQACSWTPGKLASPSSPRIPGPDEMRYLVYTTAAYGAHGIYYYVYCRKEHVGSIVALDGTPDAKYEALKTLNREFVAISRVLSSLNFTGAYFQGLHATGTTPYCEQALLKIAPETPYAELQPLQELTDTTLVTRFDSPGKPTHLMVVNCDYRKDRTLHIKAPSDAERFDPRSGKWSPVGAAFDLSLVRGGGVLLRLP